MDGNHIGKFKVLCSRPNDFKYLEAAQRGCAILRCEFLGYMRAYDIVALHPDFDFIPEGHKIPEYDVMLTTDPDGKITRTSFVRVKNLP